MINPKLLGDVHRLQNAFTRIFLFSPLRGVSAWSTGFGGGWGPWVPCCPAPLLAG